MATLTIRNLSTKAIRALKAIAKRNRRSMEQEVRELIEARVRDRLSTIAQIERSWAAQKRTPSSKEVEAWIREGRL
jgi:plasmid stability protein